MTLMHQRFGHRSTRSLMAGDTANVWEDVELRIDPDPFYTSCNSSSMNKKARSKIPLKPRANFKWILMDIIPSSAPKSLTNDTTFIIICWLLMPTLRSRNFMAWKISLLQKLWTNWICSSPDSGKLTNLAGGVWKESQKMQVLSLPWLSSNRNVKLAEFV